MKSLSKQRLTVTKDSPFHAPQACEYRAQLRQHLCILVIFITLGGDLISESRSMIPVFRVIVIIVTLATVVAGVYYKDFHDNVGLKDPRPLFKDDDLTWHPCDTKNATSIIVCVEPDRLVSDFENKYRVTVNRNRIRRLVAYKEKRHCGLLSPCSFWEFMYRQPSNESFRLTETEVHPYPIESPNDSIKFNMTIEVVKKELEKEEPTNGSRFVFNLRKGVTCQFEATGENGEAVNITRIPVMKYESDPASGSRLRCNGSAKSEEAFAYVHDFGVGALKKQHAKAHLNCSMTST